MADVYEMFWDCAFCDAKALLGKTHRHCPNCGAPQDPKKRYFPPPGQEVRANDTYDGVDKVCPACATPNGAKAHHCRQCGSPLDEGKDVARVADRVQNPLGPAPAAPPKKTGRFPRWLLAVLGGVGVLCCGTSLVATLWTKGDQATVQALTWARTVDVEVLREETDSAWCDQLPSGARVTSRSREQRDTKRTPDGQDCETRDVDRGDGTFERKQVCQTRYREEPIYDDRCHYLVQRWRTARTERSAGGRAEPPAWPAARLTREGSCLGCERLGARKETLSAALVDSGGKDHACELDAARWQALREGGRYPVEVRVMTGGVVCDSLKP